MYIGVKVSLGKVVSFILLGLVLMHVYLLQSTCVGVDLNGT
jgi:hypothetical protein